MSRHQEEKSQNKERNKDEKQIGSYLLGKTIGEGTFGKVKLATHKYTNENVAIKILDKSKMIEDDDVIHVQREISILKKLKHRNIVQLYEIIQTKKNIYLIMDYAEGGELFEYISNKKKLTEIESCKFFQDIINGLEYLHKQNIAHRDLKPENLLLDFNKNIKITDFGLSTVYSCDNLLKTPCGTPSYAPPEMLKGQHYYGLLSDIWSAGIILYAMLVGYLPFSESSKDDVVCEKIVEGSFEIPSNLSAMAVDLLKNILKVDPNERFDLEHIKQHPWFNLLRTNLCQGIIHNYNKVPIDYKILASLSKFNIDLTTAEKDILDNKHNSTTATYYLALRKFVREGGKSISDLSSRLYVDYINSPDSLIKQTDNRVKIIQSASCKLIQLNKGSHPEDESRVCLTERQNFEEFKEKIKEKRMRIDINTMKDKRDDLIEYDDSLDLAKFHKIYSERAFPRFSSFPVPLNHLRTQSEDLLGKFNVKKMLSNIRNIKDIRISPIQKKKSLINERYHHTFDDFNMNYSMSMSSFESKIEEEFKVFSNERVEPSFTIIKNSRKKISEEEINAKKEANLKENNEKKREEKVVVKEKGDIRKVNIDYNKSIRQKNLKVKVVPSVKINKDDFEKIAKQNKKQQENKRPESKNDVNFFSNISGMYISEDNIEVSVEKKKKNNKILDKMFQPVNNNNNKIKLTKINIPTKPNQNRNQQLNILKIPNSPQKNKNQSILSSMEDITNIFKNSSCEQFKDFSKTNTGNLFEMVDRHKKVKKVFAENKENLHKKLDKLREEMEKSKEKYKKENLSLKSKVSISTQYSLPKKMSDKKIKKRSENVESPLKVSIDTSTKKVVKMQFNYLFQNSTTKQTTNQTNITQGNTKKSNLNNCLNIPTIQTNKSNPGPERKNSNMLSSKSSFDEILSHIPHSEKTISIQRDFIPVPSPIFVNYNITIYDGIIDLNCLSSHCANKILETSLTFLKKNKIYYAQTQRYKLRCSKNGITFDIEICLYESFSYIKFKKTQGDFSNYLSMTSQLLREIKSI